MRGQKPRYQTKPDKQKICSTVGAAVEPIAAGLGVAVALGAAATVGSGVEGMEAVVGAVVGGMGEAVAGTGAGVATSTNTSTCDGWVGFGRHPRRCAGIQTGMGSGKRPHFIYVVCLAKDQNTQKHFATPHSFSCNARTIKILMATPTDLTDRGQNSFQFSVC